MPLTNNRIYCFFPWMQFFKALLLGLHILPYCYYGQRACTHTHTHAPTSFTWLTPSPPSVSAQPPPPRRPASKQHTHTLGYAHLLCARRYTLLPSVMSQILRHHSICILPPTIDCMSCEHGKYIFSSVSSAGCTEHGIQLVLHIC